MFEASLNSNAAFFYSSKRFKKRFDVAAKRKTCFFLIFTSVGVIFKKQQLVWIQIKYMRKSKIKCKIVLKSILVCN